MNTRIASSSSLRFRFAFVGALLVASGLTAWAGCATSDEVRASGATGATGPATGAGGAGGVGGAGSGTSTHSGGNGGNGGAGGTGGGMVTCMPDEKVCDAMCVPLGVPQYGCDDPDCVPCALDNATPICAGGVCSIDECAAGFLNCDGYTSNGCEVDPSTDIENCSACGNTCFFPHAGAECVGGMCVLGTCDDKWQDCNMDPVDGCEANVDYDPNNCSACGVICPPGEQCEGGICGVFCTTGKANCDGDPNNGCETDLGTFDDCGFCFDSCDLSNSSAECQTDTCVILTCDQGFENCDQNDANGCEVDLQNSAVDCGTCGNICTSGSNSTPVCTDGVCGLVCDGGWADCNGDIADGCEQQIDSDVFNCGACGVTCSIPNGAPGCVAGMCIIAACSVNFADCNGQYADGCEVDTSSSVGDCGGCGNICPDEPHSTPDCFDSMCAIACDAGYGDCNGNMADGCEINLNNDPNHCSACPSACNLPHSTENCMGGVCGIASCDSGYDNCDADAANGCETNIASSISDCGSCNNVCAVPNGSPGCSGGLCNVASCNAGFANCNGQVPDGCEINTNTDPGHCGSCAGACAVANGTPGCASGSCTVGSCNSGYADCNGNYPDGCEVNLNSSVGNCGGCGTVCNIPHGTPSCSNGTCQIAGCNAGYADCNNNPSDGCEVNTQSDVNHCGTCPNVCATANGTPACQAGVCKTGSCDPGFDDCNNNPSDGCETNLNTSVGNCGGCGSICLTSHGTPGCTGGSCTIVSCTDPWQNCDGLIPDGCEINTDTNVNNCSGCNVVCSIPNGSPACTGGTCQVASCNVGFANCNMDPADGCEINTKTNAQNCGSCGNVCMAPGGTPTCVNSVCGVSSCNPGLADCNGLPGDGCEINTNTNVNNCGSCNSVCTTPHGTPNCVGGGCGIASCTPPYDDCNNLPGDGCEINTSTNVSNCGSCGNVCSIPNGTAGCSGGGCTVASCNPGYQNCNGNPADGCEINTNINVNNCGGCGNVCNLPHATEMCSGGGCGIASCDPGWDDCDGNAANGCEKNIAADVNNCGTCSNVCSIANGTAACVAGACQVATCNSGFKDCNSSPGDGCEININTNPNNCGSCGNVCNLPNANENCGGGVCGIQSCGSGFANCNGTVGDGCEVNTTNDVGNCNGCGNTCTVANGSASCVSSSCTVAGCNPPFANCDGAYGTGCEVNTSNSVGNCGSCGNNCAANCTGHVSSTSCTASTCGIASCLGNYVNVDGTCGNGCECLSSAISSTCAGAGSAGTLNLGDITTASANLVPAGKENWYSVTFNGNTDPSYHPHVYFSNNPGNAYAFDVYSNCAGGLLLCANEGNVAATAKTDWEVDWTNLGGYYDPIPAVGTNGKIYIKVYRVSGVPNCTSYTLTFAN